jgi:MinD-like ATPase involved in chromosome partitioning or flagellar assembly
MITPEVGRDAAAESESVDGAPNEAPPEAPTEAPVERAPAQSYGADVTPGRLDPAAGAAGLRFSRPGGPVVVVCGLHGGAGTSTLAYALAAQAAHESPATVLLCETDAAAGDVAALTGVASPYSLSELAAEFAAGRAPEGGTLARADSLRVIAAEPAEPPDVDDGAVAELVSAARTRYGLTVIDAGTIRAPLTRELLRIATHVVWVTLARPAAAQRARVLLAGRLVPPLSARRALVVRGVRRARGAGVRQHAAELHQVAEDFCERLVLVSDSPDVSGAHVELGERRMLSTLTSLSGFLADPGHG